MSKMRDRMTASERADYAIELCIACVSSVQKLVGTRRIACQISPKKTGQFMAGTPIAISSLDF
jgi:hypothetical protein